MSSASDDTDAAFGCFFIVCGIVFVGFLVFMFMVVVPSNENRQNRCEAAHGVVIKGGACVKKDSLVGY